MLNAPRILVLEDDADIRDDLCDLLRNQGCHVDDATDGQSALEMLEDGEETIVVLDPLVAGFDRAALAEIAQRAAAVLTIPVAIRGLDATCTAPLRRAAAHYGVLLEAIRDERRRLAVKSPTATVFARAAPDAAAKAAIAIGHKGWLWNPLLSRWRNETLWPAARGHSATPTHDADGDESRTGSSGPSPLSRG